MNDGAAPDVFGAASFALADSAADTVVPCDYVGIVSANKVPDKFERAGFHAVKSEFVDAPLIEELPVAVECKLVSYDEETCRMVGEIVNVCADESVLTDGKVDVAKLRPIAFDPMNMAYHVIGEQIGNAFSDGKVLK